MVILSGLLLFYYEREQVARGDRDIKIAIKCNECVELINQSGRSLVL